MTRPVDCRAARLSFGFPRIHKEMGERRDFLPGIVESVSRLGSAVVIESGLGSRMGYSDGDYLAEGVCIGDARTAMSQEVVVTLRSPDDSFAWMRPHSTLISMLHFPTRPGRVARLRSLGIDAISLDCIEDDDGRRLVENVRAVGWNGLEAAFDALNCTDPTFDDPSREPFRVTVLGAGAVGKHAVEAATKYGSLQRSERRAELGAPGVIVTVVGRNVTNSPGCMWRLLATTDILVDATQRSDPSRPVVPNLWLAAMPEHAVICDLVVDPYQLDSDPPTVRGIEGIPQGHLDQWTFRPDDPAWDRCVPPDVPNSNRRTVVSCYSWPGIHPEACMRRYEQQLVPLLRVLVQRGGVHGLRPDHGVLERSLLRASLDDLTGG